MFILLSLSLSQAAESEFTPELEVRARGEVRDTSSNQAPSVFVGQRTRIGGTWSRGPLSAQVAVQDVRFWGEEANTLKDFSADNVDFHVAYLNWTASDAFSLKIGRQEVNLHEQRLLGAVGWTHQGRSWDGLSASGSMAALSYDAGLFVEQEDSSAAWLATSQKSMGFLRAGWASDNAVVDLVYLNTLQQYYGGSSNTLGIYSKGSTGIMSGRFEAYGQFNKATQDADVAVNYMIGVQGTVAPEMGMKPKFTLHYDLLSGDRTTTFMQPYGTNHKWYGFADVMLFQLGSMADNRGLHDIAFKFAAHPKGSLTTKLDVHAFLAANNASLIGEEIDLTLGTKLVGGLNVAAGGAVFIYAEGRADPNLWAWLQVSSKF